MDDSFLSAEEFDERAHRLYDAGEYDQALELLRDGLTRHPDSAELHVGIGYVRMAREEYAWARHAFEAAIGADEEHEEAWVGMGEALLKFGERDAALGCFARVDALGSGEDLELGLAMGRALYREGLFTEARGRFARLAAVHPEDAEVAAARGYTLHALGDDASARRELRRALRTAPDLHEARIYLAHLLHDHGDAPGALRELERVPPAEHWDTFSLWRYVELKTRLEGVSEEDPALSAWRERLIELEIEPDAVDHLLAEVEARFETSADAPARDLPLSVDRVLRLLKQGGDLLEITTHRVHMPDGMVLEGTWEEIVTRMRDLSPDAGVSLSAFMRRAARRIRERTGHEVPCDNPEAFLRAGATLGLLRIEA
jgi:tetratricopeptide (TPR) repeat protein